MSTVAPSDVVRIIRDMFAGYAANDFTGIPIDRQSTYAFEAISELIRNIPAELIVLESAGYRKWLVGVTTLNALLKRLSTGAPYTGGMDPILYWSRRLSA